MENPADDVVHLVVKDMDALVQDILSGIFARPDANREGDRGVNVDRIHDDLVKRHQEEE